jgi:aryl-alcohol dehydrogenase-like predicted oxidoreductase
LSWTPTFVAYSPLGRAFLTGALHKANLAANDFRNMLPRFSGEAEAANQAMVDGLGRFAATKGMTNAQVALSGLLCKHPNVVPSSGTRRITYLEQNSAASTFALSAPEMAALDALFSPEAVKSGRYPEAGMVGIE